MSPASKPETLPDLPLWTVNAATDVMYLVTPVDEPWTRKQRDDVARIIQRHHMHLIGQDFHKSADAALPDNGCYTLPNGDCIGEDCMHTRSAPEVCECRHYGAHHETGRCVAQGCRCVLWRPHAAPPEPAQPAEPACKCLDGIHGQFCERPPATTPPAADRLTAASKALIEIRMAQSFIKALKPADGESWNLKAGVERTLLNAEAILEPKP